MADPTKAEPRNPTVGGETAQETVDRMAGRGGNPPHPSAAPPGPFSKPPPANIKPTAPRVYGSPVGSTILK